MFNGLALYNSDLAQLRMLRCHLLISHRHLIFVKKKTQKNSSFLMKTTVALSQMAT